MSTIKTMREAYKATTIAQLMAMLAEAGEDCGQTASNEFNMPVVLADGTEDWVVVKVSIPTGTRDGDGYDGYGARGDYQLKVVEKEAKAKERAEKKAKKIEKDKAKREAMAQAKAQKLIEAGKGSAKTTAAIIGVEQ